MFVSDWMTKKVYSVTPDEGVSEAIKLMKEKNIKHIPVVKEYKIRGIVSDRDIKDFSPSSATALDIYELHYLLAKTRVKEVMKTKVFTTTPDTPVEEAAKVMYDNNIGCLPVVEKGRLAGIISDRDIFRVLVDITGIRHGGHRVFLTIEDRPGSIKEVADIIRNFGFNFQSILTSYERVKEGSRSIVIRTKGSGDFKALKAELEASYREVRITKG
jgi:acetoin utilization protein AcuB